MKISARVENIRSSLRVSIDANGVVHRLPIPPRASGLGSSFSGGELLFLAMATCYCNDIYREAARRGIRVSTVDVEVYGEVGVEGVPARNVNYRAKVAGPAPEKALQDLMLETDKVAEIQNLIRAAIPVTLNKIEAVYEPA
jgi:organic hydroperoxide reductase OsmC/OhrA